MSPSTRATLTLDPERILGRIRALCDLGPRFVGSPGHAAAQQLLRSWLEPLADGYLEHRFTETFGGRPVECRNLWARFDSNEPGRILLAAHYDSRAVSEEDPEPGRRGLPTPGANAGASGTAVLAELAARLHAEPRRPMVDLVLFDAEEVHGLDSKLGFLGSRRFRRWLPDGDLPDLAVVLDCVATPGMGFAFDPAALRHPPSAELWWRLLALGRELGLRPFWLDRGMPPWSGALSDQLPLRRLGIPTAILTDIETAAWHTSFDLPEHCDLDALADVAAFVEALVYDDRGGKLCWDLAAEPRLFPAARPRPAAGHPLRSGLPVLPIPSPPEVADVPQEVLELRDDFLRALIATVPIDGMWTEHHATHLTWFTGALPITIVPEVLVNRGSGQAWVRCTIATVVASGVAPSPGLFAALAEYNRGHDLCAAVWSDVTANVGLYSAVHVHPELVPSISRIAALACAAQACSSHHLHVLVAPHLGRHLPPGTAHPRRGPRPYPARGLDLGRRLAMLPDTPFEEIVQALATLPTSMQAAFDSVVLATGGRDGVTLEAAFSGARPALLTAGSGRPPETALIQVRAEPDGRLGPALTARLDLPTEGIDDLTANRMNLEELNGARFGHLLGAWRPGPLCPAHVQRLPEAAFHRAVHEIAATDAVLRAAWWSALHRVDPDWADAAVVGRVN